MFKSIMFQVKMQHTTPHAVQLLYITGKMLGILKENKLKLKLM